MNSIRSYCCRCSIADKDINTFMSTPIGFRLLIYFHTYQVKISMITQGALT